MALARAYCVVEGLHETTNCVCDVRPSDLVAQDEVHVVDTPQPVVVEALPPATPETLPVFGPDPAPAEEAVYGPETFEEYQASYVAPCVWGEDDGPVLGPDLMVVVETRVPRIKGVRERLFGSKMFGPKDGPPRMPWWACLAPKRAEAKYRQRVVKQIARANGRPREIVGAIGSVAAAEICAKMRLMKSVNPAAPGGMASIRTLCDSAVKSMERKEELPADWIAADVFTKVEFKRAAVAQYVVALEVELLTADVVVTPWYRRRHRGVARQNF
jgi:hypothetical protein